MINSKLSILVSLIKLISHNYYYVIWVIFSICLHKINLNLRNPLEFFKISFISLHIGIFATDSEQSNGISHVIRIFYMTVQKVCVSIFFAVLHPVDSILLAGERPYINQYFVFLEFNAVIN